MSRTSTYRRRTTRHIATYRSDVPGIRRLSAISAAGVDSHDAWQVSNKGFPPRRMVAALLRMDGYSWSSIARAVNARGHSSVIDMVRVVATSVPRDQIDWAWTRYAGDGRAPKVRI